MILLYLISLHVGRVDFVGAHQGCDIVLLVEFQYRAEELGLTIHGGLRLSTGTMLTPLMHPSRINTRYLQQQI